MTLKIVIEEKARVDIIDAEKWYFEKSVIAAENFKKEITEAINSLNKTITEHRKVFLEVRLLSLKIFPYNIYYIKDIKTISIVAVLHNKRDNSFIKKRLE